MVNFFFNSTSTGSRFMARRASLRSQPSMLTTSKREIAVNMNITSANVVKGACNMASGLKDVTLLTYARAA
ncbi:hypothetical protein RRF57_007977 [Xylaria bambusicola]|uniref:Uncharacterized protein n=1 Tax=Xylaria bambusicola TaxID=326684 RepID=A0AAN7UW90_9PEZI